MAFTVRDPRPFVGAGGDFELHILEGYIESIYLAIYRDKALILDCGCSCDADPIVSYLKEIGRPVDSIALAVASHAHPDHLGGATILQHKYGIKIAAPPLINTWYQGFTGSIQQRIDMHLAQYVARSIGQKREPIQYPKTLDYDFSLDDHRPLPFFDDWVAYHAPGHTNHDAVLYNPSAHLFYAGDVIVKVGRQYVLPIPVIGTEQLRASFDRIKPLAVKTLALAHHGLQDVEDFRGVVSSLQLQLNPTAARKRRAALATALQSFSPALRRMKQQSHQKTAGR